MKRLLAAGSGPIYQVARAFRAGEQGAHHNPEFTILEWYRPGFDLARLMDEVEDLVTALWQTAGCELASGPFERLSYREAFLREVGIDPLTASCDDFAAVCEAEGVPVPRGMPRDDVDLWRNLLFAMSIHENLGRERPTFLLEYPASQAALARISPHDPRVAERVELFIGGVELGNGYHELADPIEQRRRFELANRERRGHGLSEQPLDEDFFAALAAGLPDASGIAIGFDRLVLVALGAESLRDVIAFPADLA